jgi:hypothetical protein
MKAVTAVIDRFEGEMAVCEKNGRRMISIPRSSLPPEAGEGDVIVIESNSMIRIDRAATAIRRRAAEEKLRQTLKKD